MATLSVGLSGRRSPARSTVALRRLLLVIALGSGIGALVSVSLYAGANVADVAVLPIGLALILPAFCVKNFRLYWFVVFLLSLQLPLTKNLNDGPAVIERLHIDYTIWNFTFDITASDLVLAILLSIWVNDCLFHEKRSRIPAPGWLAIVYLCVCLLSLTEAASPYLGLVEISRQVKFFIVFLFAVNCIDSKSAVRALVLAGVAILAIQAAVTVARFATGFTAPITLGHTYVDLSEIDHYLKVERSAEGSAVRAMGTLASPGSTVRLCMMVIPFALFLCARNSMLRRRLPVAMLTAGGLVGLALTFDRVYFIVTAVQLVLAFSLMVRDRMLKREEAAALVVLALAGLAVAAPKLYEQFTVRESSVSVRLLQYEATERMILDHPLLGVGLNNGTAAKRQYSTLTYNPYDENTQFYLEPTHNVYLSLASEIGIPGALLFFGFFAAATATAWRQSRSASDPEIRLFANMLVVVFCGVAVNGLMDPLFEYPVLALLWLYAGLAFSLSRLDRAKSGLSSALVPAAKLLSRPGD